VIAALNRLALRRRSRHLPESAANLQALCPSTPERLARLRSLVEETNRAGGTYHRLDFGEGLTIAGDYDLRRYLPLYGLPATLHGKRVLDVGTASGFLALECARRGASVVAVDIQERPLLAQLLPLLEAEVRYERCSIYDLTAATPYDLVVCGSLLLHLPDPLGAVQSLRRVCAGRAVVSTACPAYSWLTRRPICEFKGRKAEDGDYFHSWEIGATALARMLRTAGFSRVDGIHHFSLDSEPGRTRFATPHVVLTAS
jgi:2-polyprenyl-3-methyl-5-hydroxy-6-metoxy-1,4-benzoquinol methylase